MQDDYGVPRWINAMESRDLLALRSLALNGELKEDVVSYYGSIQVNPLGFAILGDQREPFVDVVEMLVCELRVNVAQTLVAKVVWGRGLFARLCNVYAH